MKATGIVRRIDDLGRVVIPKEIRRTMRIREGDPLEIYTDKDGEVIFKKYSLMGGLSEFSEQICDALYKNTGYLALIADRDTLISSAGGSRRELNDRHISTDLERIMERRQVYQYTDGQPALPLLDDGEKYFISTAAPILAEGDVLGCVIFASQNGAVVMGQTEYKLAQTVAAFLGRHMEP
ncbi:MAG: AbrB/MazE/SpoVT family DNA-binding domain-containing protein [Clostridiales bacterium]|nr:AbrB/MazE/SpoVT family DNA-binding domain-containing protein [Clostridiales bacterium]